MFNLKNSFVALASLVLFICVLATSLPLTSRGQSNKVGGPPRLGPREFYLTNTQHNGSEALTACADGYHMASLWEILDPSNRSYNPMLGVNEPDSGSGPPANVVGWIRTGSGASGTGMPGSANCQLWTSANATDTGTVVFLITDWDVTLSASNISPWVALNGGCSTLRKVWCVQD